MTHEIPELLEKLPFYDKLTDSERSLAESAAYLRDYHAGQLLTCSGECLGMVYVLSGILRATVISEEGREITLFRIPAGELCVISASCVMSQITFETQLTAEEPAKLLIIGTSAVGEISRGNVHVRCLMYELMCERFSSVMWTMQQIIFARFDRRLADFLLAESERLGTRELAMTHEQIAAQVNSAREVVARMMKRFASEGLVESKRGLVRLVDIEGLKNL